MCTCTSWVRDAERRRMYKYAMQFYNCRCNLYPQVKHRFFRNVRVRGYLLSRPWMRGKSYPGLCMCESFSTLLSDPLIRSMFLYQCSGFV